MTAQKFLCKASLTGEYGRYKLGNHVLLVKMADLTIVDIIRNAELK